MGSCTGGRGGLGGHVHTTIHNTERAAHCTLDKQQGVCLSGSTLPGCQPRAASAPGRAGQNSELERSNRPVEEIRLVRSRFALECHTC